MPVDRLTVLGAAVGAVEAVGAVGAAVPRPVIAVGGGRGRGQQQDRQLLLLPLGRRVARACVKG
jgi:hypothetical protein